MSPVPADPGPRLDNLTLAHKEGWRRFAEAPDRVMPEQLTTAQLSALSPAARAAHARDRRVWHANLGPIRTPQLAALHEDLWDIADAGQQDGDKAKGAVAVDAFPGLGKTTAVLSFARKFHLREIAESGPFTGDGHERWPVCRVGLTGNTGMKDFNRAMLDFFGHPGEARGTTTQIGQRALDCFLSCEVRVLVVDDLHFLRPRHRSATEISNHFKYIANEFPVTLLFVGVGLAERGLFGEIDSDGDESLAQTGRRTTALTLDPFLIDTDEHRHHWRSLLLAVEQLLVLAGKFPGMLADHLSDYLFARSTGHIGSLMTLVARGCQRAIRTGAECLDTGLLDQVKNDAAAEAARTRLAASLADGRLTSRPRPVTRRAARSGGS